MKHELEVISHEHFTCLNILTVELLNRTLHVHQELELGLVLRGNVLVRIGNEEWNVPEDELYLINPMDAHAFRSDSGAVILAIQISLRLLESFLPGAGKLRYPVSPLLRESFVTRGNAYYHIKDLCVDLGRTYYCHKDNYELECFRLTVELLSLLHQNLPYNLMREEDYFPRKHKTERIISITDYIDENYTRKLLLGEIAKREHLTMTYLSHLFQEVLGISFQQYLQDKRFSLACTLLRTSTRSVLDISLECGFSDVRYMNNLFQSRYHMSPGEYRSQMHLHTYQNISGTRQEFLTDDDVLPLLTNKTWS